MKSSFLMQVLFCALLIVVITSCAEQSIEIAKLEAAAELSADTAPQLPGIPGARSISGIKETMIPGYNTLQRSPGAQDFDTALLLSAGSEQLEWGMYGFDPQGKPLDSLAVMMDLAGSGEAWVALADYSSGRWEWHGPLQAGKTFAMDEPRYLSPSGQLFWVVATRDGSGLLIQANAVRTISPGNIVPQASLSAEPSTGTCPLHVKLDASLSTDEDGSISYYLWDFDGDDVFDASSFEPYATHDYDLAGSFQATVAVVDSDGDHGSAMLEINVEEVANTDPLAAFGSDRKTALAPFVINFDASDSQDPDGSIVLYEWDFNGDGVFDGYGSTPLATHTYPVKGMYSPRLRVTDDRGGQASTTQLINLPSEWSMFGMDLRHTRQSPYTGAQSADLRWTFETGDDVFSSPVVDADGTLYIGSIDGRLYAINPDGSLKWDFLTGAAVYSTASIGSDGTIYFGSDDYNLYALNPDGTEKWHFPTGYWVFCSPAIGADGTIYVGSLDNNFYALNPDGKLKWTFKAGDWVRSSPAFGADGSIYFGCYDYKLYALNPDGSLKWTYLTGKGIYNSPAVARDGTIYFGSFDDNLYAMNPDGSVKWTFPMNDNISCSPSIAEDGTIYVGGWDTYMYALSPDGTAKWSFKTGNWAISSPAIGADGSLYFGSADHWFYCLDSTGALVWKYRTGNWVRSSPAIAADGTVYVGSEDGKVYAFGD